MNIDLTYIVEKGTGFVQQAAFEDKACNYELAVEAYMAASDCFIHATKYGIMDEEIKQNIHAKAMSYVKRAEEIKSIMENEGTKKEILVDDNAVNERVREALVIDSKVTFDDVIGLADAKTVLLEAVILPVKYPKLFQDNHQSSTSILLYGFVGTGKTYLAKSIAAECKTTFISVSSWMLFSKWLGESEKYVQSLFELARERQPCILLIDDSDGVFVQRNDSNLEPIRQRIKAKFLSQLEDIRTNNTSIFFLAVTSSPWKLDADIQRRFEKRIYIPLPNVNERIAMFKMHFDSNTNYTINEGEWMQLAEKTQYYSGADIATISRGALVRCIRSLISATHFKRSELDDGRQLWFACSPEDRNAEMITIDKIESDELYIPPVTMSDMLAVLDTIKPTASEMDITKYQQFSEEFGDDASLRK